MNGNSGKEAYNTSTRNFAVTFTQGLTIELPDTSLTGGGGDIKEWGFLLSRVSLRGVCNLRY